jgi:hypothetical protein
MEKEKKKIKMKVKVEKPKKRKQEDSEDGHGVPKVGADERKCPVVSAHE